MAKSQNKDSKDEKDKDELVGRVRKVVKKSRRKLGEEKFEKELQRTIGFLTELRDRLKEAPAKPAKSAKPAKPAKVSGNGKDKALNQKAAKPKVAAPPAAAQASASAKAPAKAKATK
ncbi:MAG: hypothetical protein HYR56_23645 [Acidobacteria bacterium]|nr:hypothetical protein [Acidobacteriota bacterium]MBI3422993.1 hypothetical protein [Acidobacteriota bacterium]